MRLQRLWAWMACLALAGCIPQTELRAPEDDPDNGDLVAGAVATNDEWASAQGDLDDGAPLRLSGIIAADGEYHLFDLPGAAVADEWEVRATKANGASTPLLVALFNAEQELLQREIVGSGSPLRHIVRTSTPVVTVGVALPYTGNGERFDLQVYRTRGERAPAPREQVVWLNFAGATNVSVHARHGITLAPFDARSIGAAYAGETATMKAAIVAAMKADYAPYNVTVLTSDDGPAPNGPHATVHFGGSDARLLGLADRVDQYNEDPWQTAVVYVEGFSDFAVMRLTAQELGQMIGNVGSHEFGHLLGLFHTKVPADIMDTTGTAWDLVADQSFLAAELEPSVFPYGRENSPRRLTEILGARPAAPTEKLPDAARARKSAIRAMAREAMTTRCGTCLQLNE